MNRKEKLFYILYSFLFLFLISINFIPVNYEIKVGGDIEKVKIGQKEPRFYKAFVKYKNPNLLSYLSSYLMPKWERVKIDKDSYRSTITAKQDYAQGKIDLDLSYTMAVINAYKKAGMKVETKDEIYIYESKVAGINEGDIVVSFNGEKDFHKFKSKLENNIVILRNGKKISKTFKKDDEKKTSLLMILVPKIINKKYMHQFDKNEYGPSAGLAYSVSIYNNLIKKDLTYGKKIVLSGFLNKDGLVLPVGGIPDKLEGAINKKSDIFIMSYDNKKEAEEYLIKTKLQNKIKVYFVKSFNETIDILEHLNG